MLETFQLLEINLDKFHPVVNSYHKETDITLAERKNFWDWIFGGPRALIIMRLWSINEAGRWLKPSRITS
jgi:hypothetical protein